MTAFWRGWSLVNVKSFDVLSLGDKMTSMLLVGDQVIFGGVDVA